MSGMSGYFRRCDDYKLCLLAESGAAVRYMTAQLGLTAKDVAARLRRSGYDVRDVGTDVRRRVVEMRRSGATVEAIAVETGILRTQVIRLLALRGIEWKEAPPPPEPQADPWDRPRPVLKPVVEEWPF